MACVIFVTSLKPVKAWDYAAILTQEFQSNLLTQATQMGSGPGGVPEDIKTIFLNSRKTVTTSENSERVAHAFVQLDHPGANERKSLSINDMTFYFI